MNTWRFVTRSSTFFIVFASTTFLGGPLLDNLVFAGIWMWIVDGMWK